MNLVKKMLAGRYEIIEEIGKGGMANVYKAQDHFLNRTVAVKVLKEELRDDKEFVHRFNTEAQAAARISNPHVVSIYDVGFENGLYYIIMEYVEGITLKEYIAEKRILPWKQAAEFAAQICEGLDAAHKQSVIHRDIKPQNIIMTPDKELKVTDFGIARATTQATTTNSTSTIGTVHYLSPEQARGGYTNERTDIYSLGVVLYEMLTGKLPFNDSTAVAIAIKHIQEKPILPRVLNDDIPVPMEQIVMKAMNKEQDRRYESAEAFLADLKKVIENPRRSIRGGEEYQDDIETTRKQSLVDEDDIERYEKKKKHNEVTKTPKKERDAKVNNSDKRQAMAKQKKKERRITFAAIIAAIIAICGLAFAFTELSGGNLMTVFNGGEKTEIPNLIGRNIQDAQREYKTQGISIIKIGDRASEEPAGNILEQTPSANSKIGKKADIIINVIVSAGSEEKTVEDYTNMKIEDAKKAIEKAGFVCKTTEEYDEKVEKDKVISQTPRKGEKLSTGAVIALVVSKGKDDKDEEDQESKDNKKSLDNSKKDSNDKNDNSDDNTSRSSEGSSASNSTGNSSASSGSSNNSSGSSNHSESSGSSNNSESTGSTSNSSNGSDASKPKSGTAQGLQN